MVAMPEGVDQKLARRLGYKRVLIVGKDVALLNAGNDTKKTVIYAKNMDAVARHVKSRDVVGFIFDDSSIIRKALEEIHENGKLVVLPLSQIMQHDQRARLRGIGRMRRLLKTALRYRAQVAVVSLAQNKDQMLSRMQLSALASYLGANDEQSKAMLQKIGDVV